MNTPIPPEEVAEAATMSAEERALLPVTQTQRAYDALWAIAGPQNYYRADDAVAAIIAAETAAYERGKRDAAAKLAEIEAAYSRSYNFDQARTIEAAITAILSLKDTPK